MVGYKVLSKSGLKGPFRKSSIIKAITTAMLPLQARLLDLETGRYLCAAELVGEAIEKIPRAKPETKPEPKADHHVQPAAPLTFADEAKSPQTNTTLDAHPPAEPEHRVILTGKTPLLTRRAVRLPAPRKLAQISLAEGPEELDLNQPAA
jgi:hypothetical protein